MAAKKKPKPKKRETRKAKPVDQALTASPVVAKVDAHQWTDGGDRVLILKRINSDGTSYGGFSAWGNVGEPCEVTAPDWNSRQECGGGLHGWPWGMGIGDGSGYSIIEDRWLVLAAKPEDIAGELDGGLKCKARSVQKIYDGVFTGAWALINSGRHRLIDAMAKSGLPNCATGFKSTSASSGNSSTSASSGNSSKSASSGNYSKSASSGDYSTSASSGNSSTSASSGDSSKSASSGDSSTSASSGDYSKSASSGDSSTSASSGNSSTSASSGDSSTSASSGNSSKSASSGDYSTSASSGNSSKSASSGDYSKSASSGNYSTSEQIGKSGIAASIGNGGLAKAGEDGCLIVCWWSEKESRYRACVGYVGEDGIKANTWYRVADGKLVEA